MKRVNADHVIIFGISIPDDGLEGSGLEIWNLDIVPSSDLSLSLSQTSSLQGSSNACVCNLLQLPCLIKRLVTDNHLPFLVSA